MKVYLVRDGVVIGSRVAPDANDLRTDADLMGATLAISADDVPDDAPLARLYEGADGVIHLAPEPPAGVPVRFDAIALAWIDPRTLDQHQADKWTAIKAARDAIEFGGFTWDGSTFDSDPESQSRIQGAAQLATLAMIASQAFSVDWTLATNAVRTLTGADMLAVGQAMGVHIMTTHATGRALREAIEAATIPEQLESIVWPTT